MPWYVKGNRYPVGEKGQFFSMRQAVGLSLSLQEADKVRELAIAALDQEQKQNPDVRFSNVSIVWEKTIVLPERLRLTSKVKT